MKSYRKLMSAVLGLALAVPAFAWQSPAAPKAEAAPEKKTEATPDKKTEAAPDKTTKNDPKADITSKPAPKVDPDYIIGVDDVLAVNVWREPDMSRVVNVRPDGKVTLPLLGEFEADGQTPKMLEAAILKKLQTLITSPEVSVIVQEIRSQKYNVVGEVMKPGVYMISGDTTVLDAIAQAGGFKEFARPKKMYILRKQRSGGTVRIAVNYDKIVKGEVPETNIKLETRDTVVVP